MTQRTVTIPRSTLEYHRHRWLATAYKHGWARDPFPIQVFVSRGRVVDSVTYARLTADVVTNSAGQPVPYTIDEEA